MLLNDLSGTEIDLPHILHQIRMLVIKMHQSVELSAILNIVVSTIGKILESDRAIIYRFLPDGDGVVAAESVSPEFTQILGQLIYDPCFNAKWVEQYREGRINVIEDINAKPLDPCYKNLLTKLQVRANLVVPIFINSQNIDRQVWGLLITQQCSGPRQWSSLEIQFLQLVATELGIALQPLPQFHQNFKNSAVPPKQKLRLTKRTLHKNYKKILARDITQQQTFLEERQRAEDQLRWQEALLRSMTDTSLLAFFVVDNRTDEILYLNHRFCEIWGIEHLEARMRLGGMKNNDIIPDCITLIADVSAFAQSCKPLQSEENRCTIEDEIVFIDGRIIRRFSSQIRDSQDQYFGRLYIFEDITPRKQIAAALKASEERWQYALEGNGDGVWDWNVETQEVFFSRRWKGMLGFAEHEIGNTLSEWDQRVHSDDKAQVYEEIEKYFRGETQQYVSEHRVKCKDGTYKWVLDRGKIFSRRDDSSPLRVLGTHTDITERKQMEEALRESEERYRSVITTMAEGIVLQQGDGRITACNDSAERILGLTADQMMGRTSIDPRWSAIHEDGTCFPGETHPAIVTLRTGQPQSNVVMGIYTSDGSLKWVSINSQPLFQADELTPYAVVTSFVDITIRKQAQQALQQQMEQERMVAAIAQHIRQSLDLDQILNTTVAEVRQILQTDRVIIYRFNLDWSGVIITESVGEGWKRILNMKILDSYVVEMQGQLDQQCLLKVTPDIYNAGFADCHLELLEQLQVRAKLFVPILQGDRLWGLLVAHHCSAPREWQPWESELLQQLATHLAIAIQQSELYQQLQLANQQLENMAMVDQLTQIANRRSFDSKLNDVWQNLLREKGSVSLLLCDIDYFKQFNDTYGHAVGDDCLRLVAQALKQTVKRSTDLAARYGGEEFVVILSKTNTDGAIQVAQEIHAAIQQLNIPHVASAVKEYVTLSIGIATVIPTPDMVPLDLISAADQALYQAKAQGRNRSFFKLS
ncbi:MULTISPECIES: diguanylate cyclase [unclassified Nodularia (in: cyanobacteria)]|uniref:diguanylate cyclase domain-containing protein n=1 Tax=unclassified Nodularia (in: cyanobacteria) TaxID=2656917 RepID=UPI0018817B27|nr:MULTISPECIES: diguanylate cyclase [unclassified Nodularia (in: cyanobacteria)]MBE9202105.1 diguanylate cyclase [Nodularia sp. LEGE 06071]MCC2695958.1 diguanylate cyclase [Nodularia sp. LEGE 04288]